MKQLPEIGSKAKTAYGTPATIIAHYKDKAVYIFNHANGFERVNMAVADWFTEIEPFEQVEQTTCKTNEHNFVQMHESHVNKAFCSRCGTVINLE